MEQKFFSLTIILVEILGYSEPKSYPNPYLHSASRNKKLNAIKFLGYCLNFIFLFVILWLFLVVYVQRNEIN